MSVAQDLQELQEQAELLQQVCRTMQNFQKAITTLIEALPAHQGPSHAERTALLACLTAVDTAEALKPKMTLAIKTLQARISDLGGSK